MQVRFAIPGDAPAIAGVHVRSWQAAYRGVFPQGWLDGLTPEERIPMWERHLANEALVTLVIEDDGSLAGFALLGLEAGGGRAGEVLAIYLDPPWWGRGAGRELLAAAEGELAARGHREAVLWVLDGNERARRFYEACGWVADGGVKSEPVFGQAATEVRYRRALA